MGQITDHNHGPRLTLAAALMLCYSCIALGIRLTARWPASIGAIQKEDIVLAAAAICSIGYTACIGVAITHGLGRHEDDISQSDMSMMKTAILTSFLFFFATKGLANFSYTLFLRSLSEAVKRKLALRVAYGIIAATALAGVIAAAVRIAMNSAPSKALWIVLGVVEIVTLVALFGINMWMIWAVQVSIARKVKASLWFSLVLIVGIVIILRLVYTPTDLFRRDYTFNTIEFFIFLTVEMHLCIMNAAYPNLLVFVNKASTGFLNTAPRQNSFMHSGSGNSNRWRNESIAANSLKLRDDPVAHLTNTAYGGNSKDIMMASHGSQSIMVQKSVTVEV